MDVLDSIPPMIGKLVDIAGSLLVLKGVTDKLKKPSNKESK